MDFKFSKGSNDAPQLEQPPAEKKNQSALLVLLLILIGGFSYIYFFTGLIKQPEAPNPVATKAPTVVKMALPPRDGETVLAGANSNNQGKVSAVPGAQASKPVQGAATVVVAPVAPASNLATQILVKPKVEPAKLVPAKVAEKKVLPAEVVEKKSRKAVIAKTEDKKLTAEKKPMPSDNKADPSVKPVTKKVPSERSVKPHKSDAAPTVAAKEVSGSALSLLVGHYVLEEALSTDMGRVRKAGFKPVVMAGARKKTAMNRLVLAEYENRVEAQSAITKLKRYTSDAFIVEHGGKQIVYAGSYLLDARAASEKERLNAAGFQVTLKRVEIAIPTQSLTVGPFSDKQAADVALGKLKGVGIKATPVHQ